ncbi:MAG: formylglycine-generating enzyme family protein [Myxococcota bacterium]|nr:formylglycine-generating enzyme family protein [Myxococcota bacterium]
MVLIPAGTFMMGSPKNELQRGEDEQEHEVTLNHNFYIGKFEVTQDIWEQYLPNRSRFRGPRLPISDLTWFDAVSFVNAMSEKEGLEKCYVVSPNSVKWKKGYACNGYRLPSEAEWEYATKGGDEGIGGVLDEVAWTKNNSGKTTHPVGEKKPNGFGLYDTLGNVWEWVWDLHKDYPSTALIDPVGAKKGKFRIRRGGGYSTGAKRIRIADRYALNPENRHSFLGIRVVRTAKK